MEIVKHISEIIKLRKGLPEPVGFVPTMGYLHDGHISLVNKAREECASVIVSIFVNPTQFAPNEDLTSYPRDLKRDFSLLEKANTDIVWVPTTEEMYPQGFQTWIEVTELTKVLEGAQRPTHFRGVTTIVAKLFNAVQPTKAYFGQKDAQQAVVIKRMVKDLNYPIDIVVCPIVREPDGLALSSRNTYLSPSERKAATILFKSLTQAKAMFQKGICDAYTIREAVEKTIRSEPLARLQYVSCANPNTLKEIDGNFTECLLSLAVFVGKTRLIDNILLHKESNQ